MYRMKKFYETYNGDEFVTALLTQISWTNHLSIMTKAKTPEERHFYLTLCVKESYSSRELERQINSGYYERYMLSSDKLLPEPIKGLKENPFLDSYVIEFLDLPRNYKESDFSFNYLIKKFYRENCRNWLALQKYQKNKRIIAKLIYSRRCIAERFS